MGQNTKNILTLLILLTILISGCIDKDSITSSNPLNSLVSSDLITQAEKSGIFSEGISSREDGGYITPMGVKIRDPCHELNKYEVVYNNGDNLIITYGSSTYSPCNQGKEEIMRVEFIAKKGASYFLEVKDQKPVRYYKTPKMDLKESSADIKWDDTGRIDPRSTGDTEEANSFVEASLKKGQEILERYYSKGPSDFKGGVESTTSSVTPASTFVEQSSSGNNLAADKNSLKNFKTYPTFEAALEIAKTQGKPIFIYARSETGGWDKKFEEETLANQIVFKTLDEKFILVIIDVDLQKTEATKFKVRGTPTEIFFSSDGTEIKRIPGYVDTETFLKTINDIVPTVLTQTSSPAEQTAEGLKPVLILKISASVSNTGTPMVKSVTFEQSQTASQGKDIPMASPGIDVNARINQLSNPPASFFASMPYKGEDMYTLTLYFKDGSEPKNGDNLIMPIRIIDNNNAVTYKTTAFYVWQ